MEKNILNPNKKKIDKTLLFLKNNKTSLILKKIKVTANKSEV